MPVESISSERVEVSSRSRQPGHHRGHGVVEQAGADAKQDEEDEEDHQGPGADEGERRQFGAVFQRNFWQASIQVAA